MTQAKKYWPKLSPTNLDTPFGVMFVRSAALTQQLDGKVGFGIQTLPGGLSRDDPISGEPLHLPFAYRGKITAGQIGFERDILTVAYEDNMERIYFMNSLQPGDDPETFNVGWLWGVSAFEQWLDKLIMSDEMVHLLEVVVSHIPN